MNYIVRNVKRQLLSKSGRVIGVLAVAIDITMERVAERLQEEKNCQKDFINFMDNVQQLFNTFRVNTLNKAAGTKVNIINGSGNIKLSRRESEILYYLSMHRNPKEIAIILSASEGKKIAPSTVSSIINKGLYPKFDVHNTGQLIDKAISLQLLTFFPKP